MKLKGIEQALRIIALAGILALFSAAPALAKQMPYAITVDLTNQIVTIYDNEDGRIVRQCLCTSGAEDSTPVGTYTMPAKERDGEREEWYYFRSSGVYGKYATRVYKGIMFHSILYNRKSMASLSRKAVREYGSSASHGCMRLRWQDAEFIAKNCMPGTRVKIYKSGERDDELRTMLLQASYTGEDGQSYQEYLGIPGEEGTLGLFSEGTAVIDLQTRLRDCGIYAGAVDGRYRTATAEAVKQAQSLLGEAQTGIASPEFQRLLYSDEAPSAMNVTLTEGMSGPAVRRLQEGLRTLKLYNGDMDGIYDMEVAAAVKLFRCAYGYAENGIAEPDVQKAVAFEARQIQSLFSDSAECLLKEERDALPVGRVNCEAGVHLREAPSAKSRSLALLEQGGRVLVLRVDGEWCQVKRNSAIGYIKKEYLNYCPQAIITLRYTSAGNDVAYSIGNTLEEYLAGKQRPALSIQI